VRDYLSSFRWLYATIRLIVHHFASKILSATALKEARMHTRRAVGTVSRASIWQVTAKTLFAYMHDAKACSVFDINT
jgi:hypothetical protein